MNKITYSTAKRYVQRLNLTDPLDLLHDAYLNWYDKTGSDLFDEPMPRVYTVIKYTFRAHLKLGDWTTGGSATYNGKKVKKFITPRHTSKRQYSSFRDGGTFAPASDYYEAADKADMVTPLDILIAKETRSRYLDLAIDEKSLKILELKSLGLRNKDIAEDWNITRAMVTYYLRKVNQKSILN